MPIIPGAPNFSTAEVRCNHTYQMPITDNYIRMALKLQESRDTSKEPYWILSWYRSPDHPLSRERREQGKRPSQHEFGLAVDISIPGYNEEFLFSLGCALGFTGVGYYPGQGFSHWDLRKGDRVFWKRENGIYSNIDPKEYLINIL